MEVIKIQTKVDQFTVRLCTKFLHFVNEPSILAIQKHLFKLFELVLRKSTVSINKGSHTHTSTTPTAHISPSHSQHQPHLAHPVSWLQSCGSCEGLCGMGASIRIVDGLAKHCTHKERLWRRCMLNEKTQGQARMLNAPHTPNTATSDIAKASNVNIDEMAKKSSDMELFRRRRP